MGKEIERKFLVDKEKFKAYSMAMSLAKRIEQGYISDDGDTAVRVRVLGNNAFMTIKKKTESSVCRWEYEYSIPTEDAIEMLNIMCTNVIEKRRAYIQISGPQVWEVDVFGGANEGLIVAEVELLNIDEKFRKPDFITEEVTGDPKYLNTNLATRPYTTWSEDER